MVKKNIKTLKHIDFLLSKEKQTIRIEDCRELVDFLIWKMEKNNDTRRI